MFAFLNERNLLPVHTFPAHVEIPALACRRAWSTGVDLVVCSVKCLPLNHMVP